MSSVPPSRSSSSDSKKSNDAKQPARTPQQIVEDVPTMMSVALMPSSASLATVPFLRAHRDAGKAAVVPKLMQPEKPPAAGSWWRVTKPLVIPSYYKLERTSCIVEDGASSDVVSERIAKCLYKESIAAEYDTENAVARAETYQCIKFAVRIWERATQGLIVEIQRIAGCGFLFLQAAKTVLRAAKNMAPLPVRKALVMPSCVPQVSAQEWEKSTTEGLEIAANSLKPGNRMDAHVLAVESLAILSESSQCKEFCAKQILNGELLSTLLCLIESSRLHEEGSEDQDYSDFDLEQFGLMHRYAVRTLANCLEHCEESQEHAELTGDALLRALIEDVAEASAKPHDATAACRCLYALCKNNAAIKTRVVELGLTPHISAAATQCRHALLEQECGKLLHELQ